MPGGLSRIDQALQQAIDALNAVSPTARLDAEVLLAHLLKQSRVYLYTHPDKTLAPEILLSYKSFIQQRQQDMPVAYLIGHQEFWSLDLKVTPEVLIPRADTELLVSLTLQQAETNASIRLLDLGTGSGAIALAIAYERPAWQMTATDISEKALAVAIENAKRLSLANISFYHGEWFEPLDDQQFEIIVSNPPYIEEDCSALSTESIRFEPLSALAAGPEGLTALRAILQKAVEHLAPNGSLLVEHGHQQGKAVRQLFAAHGYQEINTWQDMAGLDRVTGGKKK